MNKYGTTKKPLESASLIGICFIIVVIAIVLYVFFRPGAGVAHHSPCSYNRLFITPPKSTADSTPQLAVGYLPSIQAIQLRVGANPDGRLGPETQELWDLAYNNQSCVETWPEVK